MSPESPKRFPGGPRRSPKETSKRLPRGPQEVQKTPERPPRGPKRSPRGLQEAPGKAPLRPSRVSHEAKKSPRGIREASGPQPISPSLPRFLHQFVSSCFFLIVIFIFLLLLLRIRIRRRPPRGPQEASQKTPRGIQEASDTHSRHGGGLGRRPLDPPPPVPVTQVLGVPDFILSWFFSNSSQWPSA